MALVLVVVVVYIYVPDFYQHQQVLILKVVSRGLIMIFDFKNESHV